MTNKKDVQHQVAPDLEQDVVIEHPIIVTIIVIIILQGPLRDLKEVGQLEQARSVSQVHGPPPGQWDILRKLGLLHSSNSSTF